MMGQSWILELQAWRSPMRTSYYGHYGKVGCFKVVGGILREETGTLKHLATQRLVTDGFIDEELAENTKDSVEIMAMPWQREGSRQELVNSQRVQFVLLSIELQTHLKSSMFSISIFSHVLYGPF